MLIGSSIVSDRLVMHALNESHATSRYLSWMNNLNISRYLETKSNPPKSVDSLSNYISKINSSSDSLLLGIFLKRNMMHIGNIKLGPIDPYRSTVDIGFLIGEERYWGCGYATEVINRVTDYIFNTMEIKKIIAGCYKDNIGSKKTLLKSGFLPDKSSYPHINLTRRSGKFILFSKIKE
jgi:[ribosomal protein S5]-alanine N-acetyltransferase